jgi:hypothetical protein
MVYHAERAMIPILGTLFSTPSESEFMPCKGAYLRGINVVDGIYPAAQRLSTFDLSIFEKIA